MRKYFSNPSGRMASMLEKNGAAPALLTQMSKPPNSPLVRATRSSIAAGSERSAATASVRRPRASTSEAVRSRSSLPRAATATSAPASANASAIWRPIPLLPPVTTATWPSNLRSKGASGAFGKVGVMAAIEPQLPRAVDLDERWIPRAFARDELLRGLLDGGMAGVVSHPMDNVLWKIGLLCDGDDVSRFGMTGVDGLSRAQVLELVAEASGFEPDPRVRVGPVRVAPERILAACEEAGHRLAVACERRERVILATGHPTGPILLYEEVGRLLARHGVSILRPREGFSWNEGTHHRQVRYLHGVAG